MPPPAAVWVRVSTLDQEKGLQSQEKALREYLDGHSIAIKRNIDRTLPNGVRPGTLTQFAVLADLVTPIIATP